MKKGLFARSLAALLMTGALVGAGTGSARADAGQRPETVTVHETLPDETFVEVVCNGEMAAITVSDSKFVFHMTAFEDGRYHVTGTFLNTFTWTQSGVTYTGHVTGWFGENLNSKTFNATFTLSGQGKGSDGSKVAVKGLAHITVTPSGETTAEFEKFSITCR